MVTCPLAHFMSSDWARIWLMLVGGSWGLFMERICLCLSWELRGTTNQGSFQSPSKVPDLGGTLGVCSPAMLWTQDLVTPSRVQSAFLLRATVLFRFAYCSSSDFCSHFHCVWGPVEIPLTSYKPPKHGKVFLYNIQFIGKQWHTEGETNGSRLWGGRLFVEIVDNYNIFELGGKIKGLKL